MGFVPHILTHSARCSFFYLLVNVQYCLGQQLREFARPHIRLLKIHMTETVPVGYDKI
jgi:hypothetical protein